MASSEEEFLADLVKKGRRRTAADFILASEPYIADQTFDPVTRSTGLFSGGKPRGLVVDQTSGTLDTKKAGMPNGLPIAGLFLGGIGTIFKMNAQLAQGRAAKSAANLSADYSERAAADAVQRGNMREFEVTSRGEKILADMLSAQTNSGSDANVGGQLTTRQASRGNLDFDRALVRRNAAMEAYGLRARAQGQRQEGEYAMEAAEDAALGTFLGGLADFVGGAGMLAVA